MNSSTRRPKALLAAAAVAALAAGGTSLPSSAEGAPPPIEVTPLTPRNVVTDDVSLHWRLKLEGHRTHVVRTKDPTHVFVARITVQPGARFPWHYHPGPVVVNVAKGELTYVMADDCVRRPYPAGTSFVDPGDMVHSAIGSSDEATELIATFHDVPATGPVTITEGVEAPDDCAL